MARFVGAENVEPGHEYLGQLDPELSAGRRNGVLGMAERGARPVVPAWRVRLLRLLRALFAPLLPDDYLELINPLWSTRELRGRIEHIERETPDAATIVIKPGLGVARSQAGSIPAHRHAG